MIFISFKALHFVSLIWQLKLSINYCFINVRSIADFPWWIYFIILKFPILIIYFSFKSIHIFVVSLEKKWLTGYFSLEVIPMQLIFSSSYLSTSAYLLILIYSNLQAALLFSIAPKPRLLIDLVLYSVDWFNLIILEYPAPMIFLFFKVIHFASSYLTSKPTTRQLYFSTLMITFISIWYRLSFYLFISWITSISLISISSIFSDCLSELTISFSFSIFQFIFILCL